jgi:DnaA-homolog protein
MACKITHYSHCGRFSPLIVTDEGSTCLTMQVTMQQLILDLLPDQTPSLHHFLPGENVELMAALERWMNGPVQAYPGNLFVIWGPSGCGKSFLCQSLFSQGFAPLPLADMLLSAAGAGWIIEDAQKLVEPDQQHLFRHLVRLAHTGERLLVTMDLPPDSQPRLREDVRTRLGAAHIYRLAPLAEPAQRELLAKRAEQRGWALTPEVLDYLYSRAPRDLSSLAGLVRRLDELSLEQKRRITLPLLREALAESAISVDTTE